MNQIELKQIALQVRASMDRLDRSYWGIQWKSFPNGACGVAAETLGKFIEDQTGLAPVYVSGQRRNNADFHSHAWLDFDGVIVDITADQFGGSSVLVTDDTSWHSQFESQERRPRNFNDPWWSEHCGRAYAAIVKDQSGLPSD